MYSTDATIIISVTEAFPLTFGEYYQEILYRQPEPLFSYRKGETNRTPYIQTVLYPFYQKASAEKSKIPRDKTHLCRQVH